VNDELEIWAPYAQHVAIEHDGIVERGRSVGAGRHRVAAPPVGADYHVLIDGQRRPDPRSAWQPDGVHGPSRRIAHDFVWDDHDFRAPPLASGVVYELHVGTFTGAGTYAAAEARLQHLADLGVTHVELMPLATFPGRRGWGYDGVHLWAPHPAYGSPDDLKRFVARAHALGLGVLLDVVYNHLGPDGNYLARFGSYFTDRYHTPWGQALDFDGAGSDEVRRFVVDNALAWLVDYHVDGLRLDAVHAIFDRSATHVLEELSHEVRALEGRSGRRLVLVAESDLNDPRLLHAPELGGYGLDAQWSDDLHHAIHAWLTGERGGYYADFGAPEQVADALRNAFVLRGGWSGFRGRRHGRSPEGLGANRFVCYVQSHDQVGNRAQGDRFGAQVGLARQRVAATLVLTSPFVPMIFQGEEWAASSPFAYFTDHQDAALARAVTEGRRREHAAHGHDGSEVPDPQASSTFERSRLAWNELSREPHARMLTLYRELLALRRARPDLCDPRLATVDATVAVGDGGAGRALVIRRARSTIVAHAGDGEIRVRVQARSIAWTSEPGARYEAGMLVLPSVSAAVLDGESQ